MIFPAAHNELMFEQSLESMKDLWGFFPAQGKSSFPKKGLSWFQMIDIFVSFFA